MAGEFKLGLKPPRPGSIALRFGSYFSADNLPAVPTRFGRPWLISPQMFGNDRQGDCFWAGAAEETMMLRADAGDHIPLFNSATCLKDYHDCTGPGDEGTDLQHGCAYRQKTGIADVFGNRHTIDVYTALRPGDLRELELAVFYLGIAGVGVLLPDTAQPQFINHDPWMVEPGAQPIGGHYIPCVGRNSLGDWLFVTWGRIQAATQEWVEEYMDQGVAILSRERLSAAGVSPQGLNLAQLTDDYNEVTK